MSQAEKYTDFSGVVTPLAKAPDLEAAVALIEQTHAVEASVSTDADSHLTKDPVVDYSEDWEIVKVAGAEGDRIRIRNPDLRAFLYFNTELEVITSGFLEDESDAPGMKLMKAVRCVVPLVSMMGGIKELKEVDADSLNSYPKLSLEKFNAFIKVIEDAFNEQSKDSMAALREGRFTFSNLASSLGVPGQHIVFEIEKRHVCCKTRSAHIRSSFFSGTWLEVEGTISTHNGRKIIQSPYKFKIPAFGGKKSSSEVGVYVLENHPEIREQLIARGKKYVELTSKPSYAQYDSTLVRRSYWGDRHFKAVGRIMIDGAGMRRVDSNYGDYFGYDRYADSNNNNEGDVVITDEIYLTTPPYLYGFSFVSKTWGELIIDNVSDIDFRTDAFEKLVLDAETKRVVFSLVDSDYKENTDLINGKGGGCIFLLEGNPGVGKTLTAEAIAERLHRPLYMVSVGELGTSVDSLEEALREILDTAAAWNAVLLIDEADIFLEARTDLNIERNAMVGVFLRLLEYYEGILFLTTNRAGNIDPAFFSRISMAIHYSDLTLADRLKIWKTLLLNSKISTDFAEQLYRHNLNGRQIKNCIRNANALAKAEKRTVEMADFMTVINTALKFDNWLSHQRKKAELAKMSPFGRFWNWLTK